MLNVKPFAPFYKHLKKFSVWFVVGLLSGLIYAVSSGLGLPLMAKTMFPLLFSDGDKSDVPTWLLEWVNNNFANSQQGFLVLVCLMLPLVMLIRAASGFLNSYAMNYVGIGVLQEIQKEVFTKICALPLAFFNRLKSGDIVARVLGDPASIKKVIVNISNDLIKQPITFVCAIGYLGWSAYNSEGMLIAMVGALAIPICIFPIRRVGKYVATRSKQLAELGADLHSDTIESIQSPMEIRAYNLQKKQSDFFDGRLATIFKLIMKQVRFSILLNPLIEFITALGLAFSLYLGVTHGMSMGDFMGLATALYMAYEPLKKLGKVNTSLRAAEAPLERINQVLNAEDTVPEPEVPKSFTDVFSGGVEFKNVSFHYEKSENDALSDVNVSVKPGEIIGLVGHSGAGKTTFANLVPRFYDTTQGEVLFDGINVKDLSKQEVRDQVALVPQMPVLFNTSILENIRIGKLTATDEEVIEAAKQAYAHDFTLEQEHGYQTNVGERGNSLSGGQRQRVALARAFLKNAPILVLDEATSALDNDSEEKIQQALDKLSEGRTVFIIAHRFSSLKCATRIFYFESGRLVATGTHNELIASQNGYKELYEKATA